MFLTGLSTLQDHVSTSRKGVNSEAGLVGVSGSGTLQTSIGECGEHFYRECSRVWSLLPVFRHVLENLL